MLFLYIRMLFEFLKEMKSCPASIQIKIRPPSRAASDVTTALGMVVDGPKKKGKDSIGTVSEALKEPQ